MERAVRRKIAHMAPGIFLAWIDLRHLGDGLDARDGRGVDLRSAWVVGFAGYHPDVGTCDLGNDRSTTKR